MILLKAKPVLRDFLVANRSELIERCRRKVAMRDSPAVAPGELDYGIPVFLDQLTEMLPLGSTSKPKSELSAQVREAVAEYEMEADATKHGGELLRHGFTIEQVVHDYGDLCQAITELAVEKNASVSTHDFGILNIKLDVAIAGAVTEFARVSKAEELLATSEDASKLAHELRNLHNTTVVAISAMRRGAVSFSGATGAALDRSLVTMSKLIDRTIAQADSAPGPSAAKEAAAGRTR